MPENEDVVSKRAQRRAVGRHGVVSEIAGDDLREPFPGFRNWPVHSMPQPLLDLPELRAHAVATWLPPDPEVASSGLIANEHKAQELEGFRFGTQTAAGSKRKPRYPSATRKAKASSRRVPSRASGLSAFDFRRVLSFDPQPVFFVPVLDRQFGIALEAVVIGADLRFDPARFVAQQQMHARRRLG